MGDLPNDGGAVAEAATAPKRKQNRSSEERAMRDLIVPELRKRWPSARIVHELPLRYSERRIDLAAICTDRIVSVEIKSSRDVADRLEAQLRGFMPISRNIIVALAPKHNEKLPDIVEKRDGWTAHQPQYTPCQQIIRRLQHSSHGIDVWTVCHETSAVEVEGHSYENRFPWPAKMLDMLWVSELAEICQRERISYGKRVHLNLLSAIHEVMRPQEIVEAACRQLRARSAFDKASDPPIQPDRPTPKQSEDADA